jgi:hypothetical protein
MDTFTPMPIGIRPSDDSFAGAATAGAGAGDDAAEESGIAAAMRDAERLVSNTSTANAETLRMVAPQKSELSTGKTLNL